MDIVQPIIIGAGRGSRLNALTDEQPKCYAPIGNRRILEWLLDALREAELPAPYLSADIAEQIRTDYPELDFRHNADWPNNNILASLFYAEADMDAGFLCSYSDILYRPSVVQRALTHPGDIVLCVDTEWRARYVDRSQHPEDDAEKVIADGDRIVRIERSISSGKLAESILVWRVSTTEAHGPCATTTIGHERHLPVQSGVMALHSKRPI